MDREFYYQNGMDITFSQGNLPDDWYHTLQRESDVLEIETTYLRQLEQEKRKAAQLCKMLMGLSKYFTMQKKSIEAFKDSEQTQIKAYDAECKRHEKTQEERGKLARTVKRLKAKSMKDDVMIMEQAGIINQLKAKLVEEEL